MNNSKLVRILSVFSAEELKYLERFVKSTFMNDSDAAVQLCIYLRKLSPNWNPEKLERQKIWKKIAPHTPFNEVYCRKIMSNLVLLVEKFIVNELFISPKSNISRLCNFYISRYLTKDAETTLKEWEDAQNKAEIQNADFYLEQIDLLKTKSLLPSVFSDGNVLAIPANLIEINEIYYIISQLQWHTVIQNNQRIYSYSNSIIRIENILAQIAENEELLKIPAIYVYYHLYKMHDSPNDSHFFDKLNDASQQYFSFLSLQEWAAIAVCLQNYCARKIWAGETIFTEKLHTLYDYNLKKGLLFSYNRLKPQMFKNIVNNALAAKKNQWATLFIQTYQDKLLQEERENLVAYCTARVYFAENKFQKALHTLNEVIKTSDILQEIEFKALRIRCFYELQDFDGLQAAAEALRIQIYRNADLSEMYKTRYKHFISFLTRMSYLPEMDKEKWQRLTKELTEKDSNEVLAKAWLLEKIESKGKLISESSKHFV